MIYRERLIENKVREYCKHFKVVLITGARQVGKSTLLSNLFPNYKSITLDPYRDIYGIKTDPDLFLENFRGPLILDEIQYSPEVLSAIKRKVDLSDVNGQYILTGSQNFSVMKNVSETLAGRIGIINLESMTFAELHSDILKDDNKHWIDTYLKNPEELPKCFKGVIKSELLLSEILWRGGMPGLIEKPNAIVPSYFDSYLKTYIERDIKTFENINKLNEFTTFVGLCAALSAQEVNDFKVGNDIGVTSMTAKNWRNLLLASFQLYEAMPYSGNTVKKLSKKRKSYIADTGLLCFLQFINSPEALTVSPLFGAVFETFIMSEIRKNLNKSLLSANIYHWRTSGGAEVDIVIETNGKLYPIEVKSKTSLSGFDTSGLKAFRETYADKVAKGIIVYAGEECYKISPDIYAIPWNGKF